TSISSAPSIRPTSALSPSHPSADLGDGGLGGASRADAGGGGESGPVAVAEQLQPGVVDGPSAAGAGVAVLACQYETAEGAAVRAEAGAPDERIALVRSAVVPGDSRRAEAAEHGRAVQDAVIARRLHGRHHDDVSKSGHTVVVPARATGCLAGSS